MKLHSVFDSDVCCFNEVITIPEILKQVRLLYEMWLFDQIHERKIFFFFKNGNFQNANSYCIYDLWCSYVLQDRINVQLMFDVLLLNASAYCTE